ncbi:hypothetical protein BH10ACT7_BH10ACT7_11510 [soil metagenome]
MTRSKALITYYGNDPTYLGIAWELAAEVRAAGDEPIMFDMTDVSQGLGDTYNRRVLKLFRRESPDRHLRRLLRDEGIATVRAAVPRDHGSDYAGVDLAVNSALISLARDPQPNLDRARWRRLKSAMERAGVDTHFAVTRLLENNPDVRTVFVANGRLPNQRAVADATRKLGRALRVYEKGNLKDTYWLEDFSPHKRTKTQAHADHKLSGFTADEALEMGTRWAEERSSSESDSNLYSRFFDDELDVSIAHSRRTVVGLFTSSQDEFASLGEEWQNQSWDDQIEAFDHVICTLRQQGIQFYLRVHPNFITKSHASFVRERAQILALGAKHPSLKIFWHDEPASTYALLEASDCVVVWNSTVGLEASGMKLPVYHLAPSYYDLYADVRPWLSPEQNPKPDDLLYKPDADRAKRFMAYLSVRDRTMSDQSLEIRDTLDTKHGVAAFVAGLAASGGAPNARIAFSSIADTVRHRRIGVTYQAVRSAIAQRVNRATRR